MYSLLYREISEGDKLNESEIGNILEIIVSNFSLQAIGITTGLQGIPSVNLAAGLTGNKIIENSALVMSHLVRKYPNLMFRHQ